MPTTKTGGHRVPAEFLTCGLIRARDLNRTIGVIPVQPTLYAWMGQAFSDVETEAASDRGRITELPKPNDSPLDQSSASFRQ
jgi:hypothetical protein